MHVNLAETTAVVHKLFGKAQEEAAKQLYPEAGLEKHADRYPWGVHQKQNNSDGSVTITVGFKNYVNLLQFTLAPYPSCCGSRMFHTFAVNEREVTQAQLDEIMNAFVRENRDEDALGRCNRIEVVMVENRWKADRSDYAHRNAMEEPEPIENPNMKFKTLWNFFHKYGKRVRTRLEVNNNTANVLHNMEVIL